MTLIAGVRGVRKSYIIADSRATITAPDGTVTINDGAKKWINHGPYSLCAIAGDAQLGAHITKRLVDELGTNPTFARVKEAFDNRLEEFSIEYNQATQRFTKCALILVGYNPEEKDQFDAARIGEVMAAGVLGHGEGVMVDQNIDQEIIRAMHYAHQMSDILGRPLGKGSLVTVGLPRSEVIGYEVNISHSEVKVVHNYANNFEAIFYGADSAYNAIELPVDIISKIYFRNITGMTSADIIKADTMELFVFFQKIINERGYQNVGGGVFPVLMTPDGGSFYGGGVTKKSLIDGSTEQIRDTDVVDGKLCYKDSHGSIKEYEGLLDLARDIRTGYSLNF
jgi:hypothetical protein